MTIVLLILLVNFKYINQGYGQVSSRDYCKHTFCRRNYLPISTSLDEYLGMSHKMRFKTMSQLRQLPSITVLHANIHQKIPRSIIETIIVVLS